MKKNKSNVKAFTSGVAFFYLPNFEKNKSGVTIKTRNLADYKKVCSLKYNEKFKRQSDIEFANSIGRSLSIKISTPIYKKIDTRMVAVINKTIYSIYNTDPDNESRELFIYMEEFGNVDNGTDKK